MEKRSTPVSIPVNTIVILPESHVDHLTPEQLGTVLTLTPTVTREVGNRTIATYELPESAGTVLCGLYGPAMGDEPVREHEVHYAPRGTRPNSSRLVHRPPRPTRTVTLISGPHRGFSRVLYTVFGGPEAPREPWDMGLETAEEIEESGAFWREHALSAES